MSIANVEQHGVTDMHETHNRLENELQPINCECHGCMDGRPVLFKAKKVESNWRITTKGESAAAVVEAKLPGGALGFIAVLEKVARVARPAAIEITTEVLQKLGMEPQFHIDNDHGHFDVAGKSDEDLAKFVEAQAGGCGFAGRTWGDEAPTLIADLKNQGWLVEVLGGHHDEQSAVIIDASGVAINVAKATESHDQAFTYNRTETANVLKIIAQEMGTRQLNGSSDFVSQALAWFDSEFPAIADALRGIKSTEVIK